MNENPLLEKILFATGWITVIAAFIILVLVFLAAPVHAEPIINPSVEQQPILCQNTLTKWICDMQKPGATGPLGQTGPANMTPNMTAGPPGPAGVGGGQVLYFHHDTVESPAGYEGLQIIPAGSPEDDETVSVTAADGLKVFDPYITLTGYPGTTTWPAGLWRFRTFHYVNSPVGNSRIVFTLYNCTTSGTMTKLFEVMSDEIDATTPIEYLTPYVQQLDYNVSSTDRMVINVSANTTSVVAKTVHFVYEGSLRTSHVQTPLPLAQQDLSRYAYLPGRAGGQILVGDFKISSGIFNSTNIKSDGGNTSTGILAGVSNTGLGQSALGYQAGYGNTGIGQTALGYDAGFSNTGLGQTALGYYAGLLNTKDSQTAVGYFAGYKNIGNTQTALGYHAGNGNTGNTQTVIGYFAGYKNIGTSQTAIGNNAGNGNTGLGQTAVGYFAGNGNTGNSQTVIGYRAGNGNTGSNTIAIGYEAGATNESNYFEIKQNNINSNALISGNLLAGGVRFNNYPAGTATFDAGGNITSVSDKKFKTNIKPLKESTKSLGKTAIEKIKALNPVCGNYNAASGLDTVNTYCWIGTAQEIEKAIPEAVFTKQDVRYEQKLIKKGLTSEDDEYKTIEIPLGTTTKSVDQSPIIGVLILAVQEQQAQIDAQNEQIKILTERINQAGIK